MIGLIAADRGRTTDWVYAWSSLVWSNSLWFLQYLLNLSGCTMHSIDRIMYPLCCISKIDFNILTLSKDN